VIRYGTAMANCMDAMAMASCRTAERVDTHDDLLRVVMGGDGDDDDEGFSSRQSWS